MLSTNSSGVLQLSAFEFFASPRRTLHEGIFAATLCVFLLFGCVTTNASMLGTASTHRPAVLPENVALYRNADQVPRRYEEVALLNSEGDSDVTNETEMFESMKEKAGELGANAIILEALSEPSGGAKVAAEIFGISAPRKGRAVAIYVFPAEAL